MKLIKYFTFEVKNYFFVILLLIGIKIVFYEENFITYDELYSLINYTNYYTLLLKDNLNNHIINSFFGIIIGNFSYKIDYLRFTSFLFFLSGVFLINRIFKSKLTIVFVLLFFIFGNNFFVYSFLYRGYPYYFFLFSLVFFFLDQKILTELKKKIILIILAFLTALAPSNVLLIFPLILYFKKKFNKRIIIIYYIFLTSFLIFPNIFITGIYSLRKNINLENINYLYFYNLDNLINILFNGLKDYYNLIFNFYEKVNFRNKIDIFIRDDKIILYSYLFFFCCIFIKIHKKYKIDNFDKIFITHFILIIFLSNVPVARVYYPFYVFYFIYIDKNINFYQTKIKINKKIINLLLIISLFFCTPLNLDKKLNSNYDIVIYYPKIKINSLKYESMLKNNCNIENNLPNDALDIDIYFYNYLIACNKKLDIFLIKKIQKNYYK
jgi:hypothetical protein